MSMSMNEIERALRELRLSGIRATLDTRILQAQAIQEPFLDTFALILQDELDRRRSHLMERRYKQSGLDERISLADFDWRFNPKVPRAACFELHTLKFVAEGQNALIIGRPGTGKSHIANIATRLLDALRLIAGRTYSHRPGIIKSKPRVARPKSHKFMSQKPC